MFRRTVTFLAGIVTLALPSTAVAQEQALVPGAIAPSPLVVEAMKADWLTPEERASMRRRHGTWRLEDVKDGGPGRARVAMGLGRWDLVADSNDAPIELRAEAMRRLGRSEEGIALLEAADIDESNAAAMETTRARLLHALGRRDEALAAAASAIRIAGAVSPPEIGSSLALSLIHI